MGTVGMDESASGQVYWAWVCPFLPGGLQGDLRAFFSDFQWASQLDPEGGDVGSALKSGYVLKPLDG